MATFQQRSNGRWTAKIRRIVNGETKTLSATKPTRAEAEKWALSMESKLVNGEYKDNSHDKSVSLRELIKLYEAEFVPAMKSRKSVRNRLEQWCREPFADLPAMSLTTGDLNEWVSLLVEDGLSASTIHNRLNVLSGCYSKASQWKFTFSNPCKAVIRPKKKKARWINVPEGDIERVRKACWDAKRSPFLGYIFEIAVRTGMRQGEIRALRRQYIDLEHGVVHIPETKNDHPRDVIMLQGAKAFFAQAMENLPKRSDGYLFGDPFLPVAEGGITQDQVTAAYAQAIDKLEGLAIPDLTFHDLRHVACTKLCKIFPNPLALARQTGHKSPQQLFRYYNPDARDEAAELFEIEAKLERKKAKKLRKKAEAAAAREAELQAQLEAEQRRNREMKMALDAATEMARYWRLRDLKSQPAKAARDAEIERLEAATKAFHEQYPDAKTSAQLVWEERMQDLADDVDAAALYEIEVQRAANDDDDDRIDPISYADD